MNHGAHPTTLVALLLTGVLATGLSACREDEQNRPLTHTPGEYTGKADEKLSDSTREQLRERALLQGLR